MASHGTRQAARSLDGLAAGRYTEGRQKRAEIPHGSVWLRIGEHSLARRVSITRAIRHTNPTRTRVSGPKLPPLRGGLVCLGCYAVLHEVRNLPILVDRLGWLDLPLRISGLMELLAD